MYAGNHQVELLLWASMALCSPLGRGMRGPGAALPAVSVATTVRVHVGVSRMGVGQPVGSGVGVLVGGGMGVSVGRGVGVRVRVGTGV